MADILEELKNESHYLLLYEYGKNIGVKGDRITGKALKLNEIPGVCVIDFDIHSDVDNTRSEILKFIPKGHTLVTKTPSGGLHVLCRNDLPLNMFTKNNYIKAFKGTNFDIDVFVSAFPDKQQLINCPPTKIRCQKNGERVVSSYIYLYKDLSDYIEFTTLSSLINILEINGITLDIGTKRDVNTLEKQKSITKEIIEDEYEEIVDINLLNDIIDGILQCEIHNDAQPIDKEISLLPLFCALNSLIHIVGITEEFIEDCYDDIYNNANLTINARSNFYHAKYRYSDTTFYCSNYKVLLAMLYYHNNEVWVDITNKYNIKQPVYKLEQNGIDLVNQIRFYDKEMTIYQMSKKIYNSNSIIEILSDLKCSIAYILLGNLYIIKAPNIEDKLDMRIVSGSDFKDMLRNTKIKFDDGRTSILLTIFQQYTELFNYSSLSFYSINPDNLTIFHGYKYDKFSQYDESKISLFLNHIKTVVAPGNLNHNYKSITPIIDDNKYLYKYDEDKNEYIVVDDINDATCYTNTKDDEFYEYVLNWIAYIIQNIDKQTKVCLILYSDQGSGKNTFTNVLCEMLSGYSEKNITSLKDITSEFNAVLENKKLIICNELKSYNGSDKIDSNVMKSIWTESIHRIGDKYIAKRTVFVPVNGILLTNNIDSMIIEESDRRYFCLESLPASKLSKDYFIKLYNEIETPGFYENLTAYFKTRDISKFKPNIFPESNLKNEMKQITQSDVDLFIEENNAKFTQGYLRSLVYSDFTFWCENNKSKAISKQLFLSKIRDRCYESKNKECNKVWKLKKTN